VASKRNFGAKADSLSKETIMHELRMYAIKEIIDSFRKCKDFNEQKVRLYAESVVFNMTEDELFSFIS
jgi:hypothetical protein